MPGSGNTASIGTGFMHSGDKTNVSKDGIKRQGRTKRKNKTSKNQAEKNIKESENSEAKFNQNLEKNQSNKLNMKDKPSRQSKRSKNSLTSQQKRVAQIQRTAEIEKCVNSFSERHFKLWSESKEFSTYNLSLIFKTKRHITLRGAELLLRIPIEYPEKPLMLEIKTDEKSSELNNVVKNFNKKSKYLVESKYPIISQINYLIEEYNMLKNKNFDEMDIRKQHFLANF